MRSPVSIVRLVAATPVSVAGLDALSAEFPTVRFEHAQRAQPTDATVDERAWREAETFRPFDAAIESASSADVLSVCGLDGADVVAAAFEVLTRFQRFVGRRNASSRGSVFDRVLAEHAAMHDTSKPLVKADLDHAIDTWQWLLRLQPDAGLAVQLAALFHDIERLESEADRRVEQHAPDYQVFKDAHARRGADTAYEVLVAAGVDEPTASRTREIVRSHERRGIDPEVDLLNDADALSFFSLNSEGYAEYFGQEQTRKKVAYTLGRLGARARRQLARVRLRADVRRHLFEAEAA